MTDEQARADAQYAGPSVAQLGDPATDPPMTVRVHPDDDPMSPAARRVIRTDDPTWAWVVVTGYVPDMAFLPHEDVATWPITPPVRYCAAYRHASLADERRRVGAAQPLDGADAEGAAPFKEVR